jgi:hypothetical protein
MYRKEYLLPYTDLIMNDQVVNLCRTYLPFDDNHEYHMKRRLMANLEQPLNSQQYKDFYHLYNDSQSIEEEVEEEKKTEGEVEAVVPVAVKDNHNNVEVVGSYYGKPNPTNLIFNKTSNIITTEGKSPILLVTRSYIPEVSTSNLYKPIDQSKFQQNIQFIISEFHLDLLKKCEYLEFPKGTNPFQKLNHIKMTRVKYIENSRNPNEIIKFLHTNNNKNPNPPSWVILSISEQRKHEQQQKHISTS